MKSKLIKTICLIVALVMFCSSFASCKKTSQSGGKKPTSSASASEGNDSLPDSNEMNSDVISGLDIDSLSSGVDITLEDIESQYTDTSEESEHSDTSQLVEDPLFDDSAEEETGIVSADSVSSALFPQPTRNRASAHSKIFFIKVPQV